MPAPHLCSCRINQPFVSTISLFRHARFYFSLIPFLNFVLIRIQEKEKQKEQN